MSPDLAPALGRTPAIQLFRLLLTLGNHLRTLMDQRLAAVGLTTQQAAVITIVEEAHAPPTLGEIASNLGTSHQNVRQIVAALERKGLLEVGVDPSDRRARRVAVTDAVAALFSPRERDDHVQVAAWLSVLSEEEQKMTVEMLGRVCSGLASSSS